MQQTLKVYKGPNGKKKVRPKRFRKEVHDNIRGFSNMTLPKAVNALNELGWIMLSANYESDIVCMVRQVPEKN